MVHCVKASEVHKSSMRNSIKSREKQNRATKNHLSEKPARRICCEKKKKKAFLESAVSELVKDAENFL